ncbi:VCBS repeat-containing protein, partial [Deltaproteobacteria bacterium TL4]
AVSVKAKLDLNADGYPEILGWNPELGDIVVHFLNETDKTLVDKDLRFAQLPQNPWTIVGIADFDKSGPFDLVWYNMSEGQIVSWNITGGLSPSVDPVNDAKWLVTLPATEWRPVSFGDVNADGNTDIIWQHQNTGIVVAWTMDNSTNTVLNNNYVIQSDTWYGTALKNDGWMIVGTADFNNNGTLDLIWWNINDGLMVAWEGCGINKAKVAIDQLNPTTWIPIGFGDYGNVLTGVPTPDGKTDVVWRNLQTGEIVVNFYNGDHFSGRPGTRLDFILPLSTKWIPVGMN